MAMGQVTTFINTLIAQKSLFSSNVLIIPVGFHVMTIQCLAFCIIFGLLTFDSPEQHKWITDEELDFIKKSQEGKVSKTKVLKYSVIK